MRGLAVVLVLGVGVFAWAQQSNPKWKEFGAKQDALRAQGAAALATEYAREKAGDCPDAVSTLEVRLCMSREVGITEKNYEAYAGAISGTLHLREPGDEKEPVKTPDVGQEFDRAEAAWRNYRDAQCRAAGDQYFGGSIAPSIFLYCEQDTTRGHLHEVEKVYGELFSSR